MSAAGAPLLHAGANALGPRFVHFLRALRPFLLSLQTLPSPHRLAMVKTTPEPPVFLAWKNNTAPSWWNDPGTPSSQLLARVRGRCTDPFVPGLRKSAFYSFILYLGFFIGGYGEYSFLLSRSSQRKECCWQRTVRSLRALSASVLSATKLTNFDFSLSCTRWILLVG